MKNLILLFALLTSSFTLMAQTLTTVNHESKNLIKSKDSDKELSKFELQLNRGFLLPRLSANVYLKENTILRFTSPSISLGTFANVATGSKYELNTFLEFRKDLKGRAFLSHGPAVGFTNERIEDAEGFIDRQTQVRVGYNLGVGFKASKHITAGTYINPHVSFGDNGVSITHGRLFAGTLSNIYVAYRF